MGRESSIPLVILGTRLFAEEVADLVDDCDEFELVAFGENWERARGGRQLLGRPIVWIDDLADLARTSWAVCAIGTTHRSSFIQQAANVGFRFATVIHPTARVSRTSVIGEGSILSAGVVVAAQTTLGRHVIVNRGSLIGHHTSIGDGVTVSAGSNVAGRVVVGDRTYLGMGAVVLDRVRIGCQAVVGAAALVTKDVPDNAQVVGAPARIARHHVDGR